jgi:hypothetical protein
MVNASGGALTGLSTPVPQLFGLSWLSLDAVSLGVTWTSDGTAAVLWSGSLTLSPAGARRLVMVRCAHRVTQA